METYVTLVKFTEEGRKNIDDLTEKVAELGDAKRSLGGEPMGFFVTLGQYDMVAISEMPDGESTAKLLLSSALEGEIETETMRAFSMDELDEMLDELPGQG